ncbi:hypothetical protein [Streptomyces sp. M92]|uniref:hypothetical protein n=1 Tax=Streptomyces sp. M92 TaxID=2944250 RepID=UPI00234B43A1|nr:hypothetical protein [Streptomyces sp. M92]WCN07349.1 hypothetical protein M6G08_35490 [Streptomyces sp. M92]
MTSWVLAVAACWSKAVGLVGEERRVAREQDPCVRCLGVDLLQRFRDVRPDNGVDDSGDRFGQGLADVLGVPAADVGVGVAALERLVGAAAVADRDQAFLDDVGEAWVVAADADGDQGGVLVEVSLLDLR